jgi:LacI family repressor for deo operon, udp, cdd, tsx, nupC, and nupG
MASLKDVAKLAGVSVGTVSRYLNEPHRIRARTRQKIEPAIEQLSYSPNSLARSLRRGKTGLIMVLVSEIGDPYYGDVIHGITRIADQNEFAVHVKEVSATGARPSQIDDIVLSRGADGVILLGGPAPFELSDGFRNRREHPPLVVGGEIVSGNLQQLPSVRIDNMAAAEDLTRYVVGLGHRRIGFMGGEPGPRLMRDREVGFRKALTAFGIPTPDELFVYGELVIAGARRATRRLMNLATPPTAIVCTNDEMAIGAMGEARALGLSIPADVSIVGFDDIRYAEVMEPPLTTVAQPASVIGERCVYRLMRAMDDPRSEHGVQIVPHQLIVRASAAPPRG